MTSEYVPTLGEYAAVIEWLVGRKCENRWAGIAADMDEDMRPAFYDAMDRAGLRRLAKFMQDTEAIITPPDESKPTEGDPEPMTDEEWKPYAEALGIEEGPRKMTDRNDCDYGQCRFDQIETVEAERDQFKALWDGTRDTAERMRKALERVDRLLTEVMDESNLHVFEPTAAAVTDALAGSDRDR